MFPFSTVCPCWKLTRLDLLIEFDRSGQRNVNSPLCQMAILNAPNLVDLHVFFQYPTNSEQLDSHNRTLGTLNFYTAKGLPTIKVLELYGYTVGLMRENEMEHRIQTSALRELVLTPGPGSNLEVFLTTMMNSGELHLEVLELHWKFPGMLDSFNRRWITFLTGFLQHFRGLKKLVITGHIMLPPYMLNNGISWHGETLEELTLHSSLYASKLLYHSRRLVLQSAVQNIETLVRTCPRLRRLSLDFYFGDVSRFSHRYTNQTELIPNDSGLGTATNLPAFPGPGKACHLQPTLRRAGASLSTSRRFPIRLRTCRSAQIVVSPGSHSSCRFTDGFTDGTFNGPVRPERRKGARASYGVAHRVPEER